MNEDKPPKIKVLIAEDQQVFRYGLEKAIEQSPAISIVGVVSNGREVLEQVEALMPDVAILDSVMPVMDGLETAKQLVEAYPNVKIIFVSASVEYERIASALKAGASGYLKKDSLEFDLIPAIMAVNRDNVYFSPEIVPIIQESNHSVEGKKSYFQQISLLSNEREQSWFETWELCLAKEIISKWRSESKLDTTAKKVLESLAITKLELKLIEIPNAIKFEGQLNTLPTKLKRVVGETQREYLRRNT
ncbi:response regulator transcription factor, partial [Myxosarcina sp. GI1]